MTKLTLSCALKRYPTTQSLLESKITSPNFDFEFHEIEPIHDAFKPMARDQRFDVSELAIFTFLQAYVYKKPVVLLPIVLASRFQHGCIVYNTDFNKELTPGLPMEWRPLIRLDAFGIKKIRRRHLRSSFQDERR